MADNSGQESTHIGFYQFEKVIGKGNFAVVKLARHTITEVKVAIKIIDKSRLDSENRRKVAREVEIMKLLEHPNVIRLYQVMETNQFLYLVTEFASKGEIFEYLIQNGRMNEEVAVVKFCQIVQAVDYCHKKGVVHRDLKAENLLLDEGGNVKLADFGFSNHYSPGDPLKTWCGSPPYAAPELFEGREYSGPQADIWSLGVVLYVMVCGALPFDGANLQHLRARVLAGRFRIPFYMSQECEKLIRRMLHLEPTKRIPLASVLKHRWMQGAEPPPKLTNQKQFRVFGSSDNLLWNDQVLLAIQRMQYNVEACKQAVQNRLYNDHAALYYLLLSKWERGQLQIPASNPALSPHPRLSLSGVPQVIPQISIENPEPSISSGSGVGGELAPKNPWHDVPTPSSSSEQQESDEYLKDPNLARYLQHGRRHTLGAAHNLMLGSPEELERLRQISETSQDSGGCLGSTSNTAGEALVAKQHPSPPTSSLQQALSNTGVNNASHSSVSGAGGGATPNRQYLPVPPRPSTRMGRRVSDGGPYAAAYRLFIEKRSPQLAQINSSTSIDKQQGSTGHSMNSIKLLLQERQAQQQYGGLPSHHWLDYKKQLRQQQQQQLSLSGVNRQPANLQWMQQLPGMQSDRTPTPDLKTQLQPFTDYTPQQIQEQLQRLHIQQHSETPPPNAYIQPLPSPQQPAHGAGGVGGGGASELDGMMTSSGNGNTGIGSGGVMRSLLEQTSLTSSGSNSSISSSRKSSTGNSLIAQLLSPSPPANPVPSPQTQATSTPVAAASTNTSFGHSPPSDHYIPSLQTTGGGGGGGGGGMRRSSYQDNAQKPPHIQHGRRTLPDLYSTGANLLSHTTARGHSQFPSFPVNISGQREGSPTKMYSPSSTSSLGRRSPIREVQMDPIAEDITEESSITPTEVKSPTQIANFSKMNGAIKDVLMRGGGGGQGGVDDGRQRRAGVVVNNSSCLQAQLAGSLASNQPGASSNHSNTQQPNGIVEMAHESRELMNALQMPLFANPQSPPQNHRSHTLHHHHHPPHPHHSPHPPHTAEAYHNHSYTHQQQQQQQQQQHVQQSTSSGGVPNNAHHIHDILAHVSTVLCACGIHFQHSNGIFAIEHEGVQLQILVGNCSFPQFSATQSAIQLQYVAGDASQYETLCSHLYSQLSSSPMAMR